MDNVLEQVKKIAANNGVSSDTPFQGDPVLRILEAIEKGGGGGGGGAAFFLGNIASGGALPTARSTGVALKNGDYVVASGTVFPFTVSPLTFTQAGDKGVYNGSSWGLVPLQSYNTSKITLVNKNKESLSGTATTQEGVNTENKTALANAQAKLVAGAGITINNADPANPVIESSGTGGVISVNTRTGAVVLVKADVGLGNVDNTTDAGKPVSTATKTALDLKVSKEAGKQLSAENYTAQDKAKVLLITPDAIHYKGSVLTADLLPSVAVIGDLYNVSQTKSFYIYTGAAFEITTGVVESKDIEISNPARESTTGIATTQSDVNEIVTVELTGKQNALSDGYGVTLDLTYPNYPSMTLESIGGRVLYSTSSPISVTGSTITVAKGIIACTTIKDTSEGLHRAHIITVKENTTITPSATLSGTYGVFLYAASSNNNNAVVLLMPVNNIIVTSSVPIWLQDTVIIKPSTQEAVLLKRFNSTTPCVPIGLIHVNNDGLVFIENTPAGVQPVSFFNELLFAFLRPSYTCKFEVFKGKIYPILRIKAAPIRTTGDGNTVKTTIIPTNINNATRVATTRMYGYTISDSGIALPIPYNSVVSLGKTSLTVDNSGDLVFRYLTSNVPDTVYAAVEYITS